MIRHSNIRRAVLALAIVAASACSAFAQEDEFANQTGGETASERLLIVNGNNGRVVYDDGRDDLFCVTRRVFVGYNVYGRPVYQRTMRCR